MARVKKHRRKHYRGGVGYNPNGRVLQFLFDNNLVNDDGADGINSGSTRADDYLSRPNKSRAFTPENYISVSDYSGIQNIFSGGGSAAFKFRVDTLAGGFGRVLQKGSANELVIFLSDNGVGGARLTFFRNFSTTQGAWIYNLAFTFGTDCTVIISYDDSSVANNPLLYIDDVSTPLTETTTPVGTAVTDAGQDLYLGNRSAADRGMDGKIHDMVWYNKILSAGERTAFHTETP